MSQSPLPWPYGMTRGDKDLRHDWTRCSPTTWTSGDINLHRCARKDVPVPLVPKDPGQTNTFCPIAHALSDLQAGPPNFNTIFPHRTARKSRSNQGTVS